MIGMPAPATEDASSAKTLPDVLSSYRDLFRGKRILWQFFYGAYCVGLDRLLPIRLVTCLDEGSDFDLIRQECGVEICSVEQPGRRRVNWIGAGIDRVFESCRSHIECSLREHPREEWWITSSPACEHLEAFCLENGYQYAGIPARGVARFKPKQQLHEALRDLDLPRAEGLWFRLGSRTLAELQTEFGARFVLQAALGAAGSGTFLIGNEHDLRAASAKLSDASVHAAPYLGDLSLNINAAVVGGHAFAGCPNVQLSGVGALHTPWGGYCGNDYAAAAHLDKAILHDVRTQTERIGHWLSSKGFEGLYGLDYIVREEDGRAYAIDLNPRWQGSTNLSIQMEMARGRLPLAAAEFAYRCGLMDSGSLERHREEFSLPLEGAQMCLRVPRAEPRVVPRPVQAGVYRWEGGASFSRSAVRFPNTLRDDEWLMVGGVPRQGTLIEPGAWLVRVCTRKTVSAASSAQLSSWASAVAASVYRLFGLDAAGGTA